MAKTRIWGLGNAQEEAKGVMAILCPACKTHHVIPTVIPLANNAVWQFNGDMDRPTFTPSLSVKTGSYACPGYVDDPDVPAVICHSNITNGQIEFHGDSTHELKGQTMPLPDVDFVYE